MKKKTVLALDIATTTGYATLVSNPDHTISLGVYGLIRLGHNNDNKVNTLYKELYDIAKEISPDEVVIEDIYLSRNAKTFKELSQLQAAALLACHHANPSIDIKLVSSKSVRITLGIKSKLRKDIKKEVGDTMEIYFSASPNYNKKDKEDIYDAIALGIATIADPSIAA